MRTATPFCTCRFTRLLAESAKVPSSSTSRFMGPGWRRGGLGLGQGEALFRHLVAGDVVLQVDEPRLHPLLLEPEDHDGVRLLQGLLQTGVRWAPGRLWGRRLGGPAQKTWAPRRERSSAPERATRE